MLQPDQVMTLLGTRTNDQESRSPCWLYACSLPKRPTISCDTSLRSLRTCVQSLSDQQARESYQFADFPSWQRGCAQHLCFSHTEPHHIMRVQQLRQTQIKHTCSRAAYSWAENRQELCSRAATMAAGARLRAWNSALVRSYASVVSCSMQAF